MKKTMNNGFKSLMEIVSNRGIYRFSEKVYEDYPQKAKQLSDSRISSNAFNKMSNLFFEGNINKDKTSFVRIIGREGNKRVFKCIEKRYLKETSNLSKYKVVLPKANGSGAIGEVSSTPMIGEPLLCGPDVAYTETFISIGEFENKNEDEALLKYIKTKFVRVLLGILKVTQDNTKNTWSKVPMQNLKSDSDILWENSVKDIDNQLFKKYKLNEKEIEFIESNIKPMD